MKFYSISTFLLFITLNISCTSKSNSPVVLSAVYKDANLFFKEDHTYELDCGIFSSCVGSYKIQDSIIDMDLPDRCNVIKSRYLKITRKSPWYVEFGYTYLVQINEEKKLIDSAAVFIIGTDNRHLH